MIRTDKDGKVQGANHEALLAREALRRLREERAQGLLAGDVSYGVRHAEHSPQPSRCGLVAHIDDILKEPRASYELFVQFDALAPYSRAAMSLAAHLSNFAKDLASPGAILRWASARHMTHHEQR